MFTKPSRRITHQRLLPTGLLILLFSLLLISGGWVSAYLLGQHDYSMELERIRNENVFVASAFEEHARRVLKTADTALLFLKKEFEEARTVNESMRKFGAITKEDLSAVQVAISDSQGNLIYSAVPLKAPLNIAGREHFQIHRDNGEIGLFIAKPVKAVATGTWTFFLSRRLNNPDGTFAGIVSVGIDPFYFGKVYDNITLDDRRTGLIVGTDHIVRVRISTNTSTVGDDISKYSPVFTEAAHRPVGEYEVTTTFDNRRRMASYRTMPDFPLIVIVSAVKEEALANFEGRKAAMYFGASLFTLFVSFFCFLLIRADQQVSRNSERLKTELEERKKAEEELGESRNLFAEFMDHMPAMVCLFDDEGILLYQNKASMELIGTDMVGRKPGQFPIADKDGAAKLIADNARAYEVGATRNELDIGDSSGKLRTLEFSRFLFSRAGKKPHLGVIALDVTDRKVAEADRLMIEKRMQEAQKLESLGLLAGGIAHDFNNLLFGITGNIDIALALLQDGSPLYPALRRAEESAQMAADLTNQMLAYSGRGRFVIEPVNLSNIVGEMSNLLSSVPSKLIKLEYDLALDLPPVQGDATQLRQVVMNLITNAVDSYGGGEGVVRVSTFLVPAGGNRATDGRPQVCFEVSDDGCGMDAQTRAKIFEPFYTTKPHGRGLGLAAVQGIVRGHGGEITIESKPGEGTAFRIVLPVSTEVVKRPLAEVKNDTPAEGDGIAKGLILLVDDEEYVRTTTETFLRMHGYEVVTAADGLMALEIFSESSERIMAVLLDMTMPRMGGTETFLRMHKINPEVPVILSSGYAREDAVNRFKNVEMAGFIQKPYRMKTLLEMIARLVSEKESHQRG